MRRIFIALWFCFIALLCLGWLRSNTVAESYGFGSVTRGYTVASMDNRMTFAMLTAVPPFTIPPQAFGYHSTNASKGRKKFEPTSTWFGVTHTDAETPNFGYLDAGVPYWMMVTVAALPLPILLYWRRRRRKVASSPDSFTAD